MSLHRYAESSNHVMVFCEALYLNTLVSVSTFSKSNHFELYIILGWGNQQLQLYYFFLFKYFIYFSTRNKKKLRIIIYCSFELFSIISAVVNEQRIQKCVEI